MKRISTIHLKNFKAFRDQTFDFGGKHALIYGNNGSGKSSLYWALYTFLQSSGKTNGRISEYFQLPSLDGKLESLRNVYADEITDGDAYIELTWQDAANRRTTQYIGNTAANINTNRPDNTVIREADLASDFINYKLLQKFYDGTHKQEVNLWDVFMRDIFPFFDENFLSQIDEADPAKRGFSKSYRDVIEDLIRGLPGTDKRNANRNSAPMKLYEARVTDLNQKIELFINRVQRNANQFLSENFYQGENKLEVVLTYPTLYQISVANIKELQDRNKPLDLRIKLAVRIKDEKTGNWIENHRPQSFLNEAQLTRIAMAVRIGALLDRLQLTDFKILVLDDLLISLDMSNRKRVLEWLFTPDLLNNYQLIILTHDRAFYQMTKHHVDHRNVGNWCYFELYMDTYHAQKQPRVVSTGSDNVELALKHFNEYEFPACANYLRKECEKVIKNVLPPNLCHSVNDAGELKPKNLQGLLDELEKLFKSLGKDFTVLSDLKLYKDVLMNPLSHDNLGTTVHQDELYNLLMIVVPQLRKMSSKMVIALHEEKPTFITLTETDNNGVIWRYRIQLFEHWRAFTFADGIEVLSKPRCLAIDRTPEGGTLEALGELGKCSNLQDAYRKIRFGLKLTDKHGNDVIGQPEKSLTSIVTLT